MDLLDAVNAMYCQSLAAKRYLDKESVQLQLSVGDVSDLVAQVRMVTLEIRNTVDRIKGLTRGLRSLTIGELRQLCTQMGLYGLPKEKDKLVYALLQRRMAGGTDSRYT